MEGEQPKARPSGQQSLYEAAQTKKITESPEYYIGACTNTGVWMVERRDLQSGQKLAEYDFVNKMYAGQETVEDLSLWILWAVQSSNRFRLPKTTERSTSKGQIRTKRRDRHYKCNKM